MVRIPGRRDDEVDPLVGQRPLEQSLRPRLDAQLAQDIVRRRTPEERAFAERTHHDHRNSELGGERQQLPLALPLLRVERQLHDLEAAGPQRACQLPEPARRVVRHAETLDATFVALALEPG
jgi:hypothetical protein